MSECDVCNDFSLLQKATCDEKAFNWAVLKTLCAINTSLTTLVEEEDVPPDTVILEQVVKTAAQIEASYGTFASVGLIDSTKKLSYIRVVNTSDVDLEFSYDAGDTTAFTVLSGTQYTRELNLSLSTTTSLQMQKVSGSTATVGQVIIEGDYSI